MKFNTKPIDVTLEYILGVVTEIEYMGTFVEIKDSIFYFSQLPNDYGKEIRFTKQILFY